MTLNEKDKRAVKLGVVGVAAVVAFVFGTEWLDRWGGVRKSLSERRSRLNALSMSENKRAGLAAIVPVFEMPKNEEQQKELFRDKFHEQLKKAGIKVETLQYLPAVPSQDLAGYRVLRLQCRKAKCNFGQVMSLLAGLKDNPHLAGIEEFKINCDKNKREEFTLDITVSTFVKQMAGI